MRKSRPRGSQRMLSFEGMKMEAEKNEKDGEEIIRRVVTR